MDKNHNKYTIKKKDAWKIFDKIYKRYDLLNHILSLGFDYSWRKKLSSLVGNKKGTTLLDLATGTGDVLFSLIKHSGNFSRTLGIDMSQNMLRHAILKKSKKELDREVDFVVGDANTIPLKSGSFDVTTMAFGIRNIPEPLKTLKDINRILAKDGVALILEFSLPKNILLKKLHLFYIRYLIPLVGKLISGDSEAYRYLNKTIEVFPYGDEFLKLMEGAGFVRCEKYPLTLGIVTIYKGIKSHG